ncbi:hypothetical protein ACOSQ3_023159 [Xanthoceras sorbifolium]
MVKDLILESGGWNSELILNSFNKDDTEAILSLPLPIHKREDIQIWHYTTNGAYSVKSGYWLAENSKSRPGGSDSS